MRNSRHARLRDLGAVFGLGLSLVAVSCGGDAATASSSSGSSSDSSSGSGSGSGSTSGAGGASSSSSASSSSTSSGAGGSTPSLSFFVSSTGNPTADLGGLAAADKKCQDLATAAGAGSKTWRAYLSVEKGMNGMPEHAKDRIGAGPWYNAKLVMVAANLDELHKRFGDAAVFLTEKGDMVPGQWAGSPTPNVHDILTGSNLDGTVVPGKTCADWTSAVAGQFAWVGHSDGLGPMMSMAPQYRPWNSVHENGGCNDTSPKGGGGRIYCFAAK